MANEKNLIPNSQRSKSEVRENSAKGGRKSGEARRRKKTMRELANIVNSLPVSGKNKEQLKTLGLDENLIDNQAAFIFAVYAKAMKGDTRAMAMWIDLSNDFMTQKERLELKKLKAEISAISETSTSGKEVEDLSPLADLLKDDSNTDN